MNPVEIKIDKEIITITQTITESREIFSGAPSSLQAFINSNESQIAWLQKLNEELMSYQGKVADVITPAVDVAQHA